MHESSKLTCDAPMLLIAGCGGETLPRRKYVCRRVSHNSSALQPLDLQVLHLLPMQTGPGEPSISWRLTVLASERQNPAAL
jgi:hypothetical protein